jgi:hypothetical protein
LKICSQNKVVFGEKLVLSDYNIGTNYYVIIPPIATQLLAQMFRTCGNAKYIPCPGPNY